MLLSIIQLSSPLLSSSIQYPIFSLSNWKEGLRVTLFCSLPRDLKFSAFWLISKLFICKKAKTLIYIFLHIPILVLEFQRRMSFIRPRTGSIINVNIFPNVDFYKLNVSFEASRRMVKMYKTRKKHMSRKIEQQCLSSGYFTIFLILKWPFSVNYSRGKIFRSFMTLIVLVIIYSCKMTLNLAVMIF